MNDPTPTSGFPVRAGRGAATLPPAPGTEMVRAPLYPPEAYGLTPYAPPVSTETRDELSGGFSVRHFLQMLWRRRKIVAITLLSVLGATWFFSRLKPVTFESVATLQVQTAPASSNNRGDNLGEVDALAGQNRSRSLSTQLAILRSAPIQDAAVKRLDKNSVKAVTGLAIEAVEGTDDLIAVTAEAREPKAARLLANAVCASYIGLSLRQNKQQLSGATAFVTSQLSATGAKLQKARDNLRRFKEQNNITDPTAESQALSTQRAEIEGARQSAAREKAAALAQLNEYSAQAQRAAPTLKQPGAIVRSAPVLAIQNQLTQLFLKRSELAQEYQPGSEELRTIDDQIAGLQANLKTRAQTEISSYNITVNPVRASLDQQISSLKGQIYAVEARGIALKAQAKSVDASISRLPAREQRFGVLASEVANQETEYQKFKARYNSLRTTQEAKVADASILFPALDASSAGRGTIKLMILGGLLGLGLALCLAALVDWADDRVHSEEEAKNVSHLPVLAQVPYVRDPRERSLSTSLTFPSPLLENFRMLRTVVAFLPNEKSVRSLVVTSSLPGEGKTVSAANLAVAAALSGERVILIDCDLRRPAVHRLFGLSNDVGYSNVAQGLCSLQEALQNTGTPGLRVLTGGPEMENPFTMLNSAQGRTILRDAMRDADFVVIDSPPALIFADTPLLASEADGVLLVVSSQEAGRREIARTHALLAQTGSKPIGIVLTKLAQGGDDYGRYQSQYYSNRLDDGYAPRAINGGSKGSNNGNAGNGTMNGSVNGHNGH